LFPDKESFVDRHGNGPTSLSALRVLLAETRQRGYAAEDGEVTPGFASVAAAVMDHNDLPVAGVAVTWPSQHEILPLGRLVRATRDTAHRLTRRLGGNPVAPKA
jgi:DNA-binding IclR family transcriptional regulator